MSVFRGGTRTGPVSASTERTAVHEEKRQTLRSTVLALGTLACGRCDAPIASGAEARLLSEEIVCPFCDRRGPVGDFLSLATPTRPARVLVRVRGRS